MAGELAARFGQWIAEAASEGLTLEFKSGKLLEPDSLKRNGRHQLTKAVASMANTEGGLVAIGVAEAPGEKGWSAAASLEPAPGDWNRDRVLQWLKDNVSPPIEKLDVEAERTDGGVLILIHVPVSLLGHQNRRKDGEGGEYRTRRANGVSEPLDGRDVRQLLMRSQLPDPVLHLVVPEVGQRVEAKSGVFPGASWRLLLATRTAVLTTYRVTLLWEGPGCFDSTPGGFNRTSTTPTFGREGLVAVRQRDDAALFPGVYDHLTDGNLRMPEEERDHFIAGLVQAPGVPTRLFAWHISVTWPYRKIAVQPPEEAWWAYIDIRDPLGQPIPYERGN